MAVKEAKARKMREKTEVKTSAQKAKPREKMLRVKLVRSLIGRPEKQREVVRGLGLKKVNSEVIRKDCPEIWGMINKIQHLVEAEVLEKK